ncbi:MAG: subtilase [Microcystis aeruginosa DA14]|uniref:Subtilase n=1 Tax=Microcystis aeruginosa DA14 TaxID=1987506 RepID=A0A3E0LXY2_MICAE|nr:MAG: subtilase [Microcystis aeruginosa DA14]
MKTTQVSSNLSSTNMPSPADSLSFDGASPITFDLTGSDDLTVSKETSPLGVLNSDPSPSTVSSESPTVPVSPAATSQVAFPASPSIDSSGYSTSQASTLASVPTAAPVTSELRPAATSTLAPYAPNQLILKFKQGITSAEVAQFKSLFGAVSTQTIKLTGAEIWKLSGSLSVEKILAQYRSNPIFEYIEPDYIRTVGAFTPQATFPNDPSFNQLWGLHNTGQSGGTPDADIDAPEAWDIQTGNPNLVIGVIDTGVDYNHQDLVGNIWTNPGEIPNNNIDDDGNGYVDDIRGWDFAYNDNNPSDVQGHGTHVSGTIAGKGNNGVGVTGVAWNAKIMPLKFLNDQGSGYTSDAILAINYATTKGVKLTNNSWGGGGFSQGLYNAINAAGQAGALFIAAAGNSGQNADIYPMYPAAYDLANIVSVASTTRTDSLSWFSNYGLTSVDLGAPGSDIYSTTPGNSYGFKSGTSMASPHVAGAAALLWSQNPTWTAQQVKNTLMNTGDPIAALAGKTVSGKRLNVFNALGGTATPVVTVVANDANAGEPANNGQYTLTRTGDTTSDLTVNIAMSGTATNGKDYTTIPATVTFTSGFSTATVDLNVIDDTLQEGTETATLTVLAGSGYTPGSLGNKSGSATASQGNVTPSSSATVSIADDEPPLNTITLNAADTGWYDVTGYHDPGNTNYFVGDLSLLHRNWFTFNLPTLTAPIISAQLNVNTYDFGSEDAIETYELRDVTTAVPTLTAGGSGKTAIYADLGDGAIYGSRNYENGDDYQFRTIELNAAAISALTAKSGQAFALGGLLTTLDTLSNEEYVFGYSGGLVGDVQLILNTGTATKSISIAKTTDGKEAGSESSVFTLTRTGDLSSALTVNYTLAGTATPGVDYTNPGAGKATFAAGFSKATITLPTKDDLLSDPSETIITTITAPTGYTISGPDNATATILDNDGNSGNNNLVGTGFADALAGVGGNDTLSGLGGNDTLDGGAGNDTYLFDTDLVLGSDLLIDASGIDTLNFAATTTKTINLNLGSIAAQNVTAGNLTLTLANATAFENVIGGSLNDNIIGNTLANSLNGGAGNDTLNGGANNDTYLFDTDLVLGSDLLIDASGIDTLNFAATTTKTINLNLGSIAAQTVTAGNLTLTLASATAFENVIGGSLNDNIIGNTLANSLSGGAGNDNLNGGAGNDTLTGGLGKDTLTGSTGLDTLTYNALGESLLTGFDVIQGYSGTGASLDSINAPGSIAAINLTASKGTATALTEAAIQLVLTNAAFAANTAAAFTVTGQSGTFIALNNGAAGFQAASDAIIQLSGYNIAVATPVVVI